MTTTLARRCVLAVAATALVLTTGGCGGSDSAGTDDADPVSIEGDDTGEGAAQDDESTAQDDEGSATAGKGLPDGFPTDDVPLVDGDVLAGSKSSGAQETYTVVISTDGESDAVLDEAVSKLEAEGYTNPAGKKLAGGVPLKGEKYTVVVSSLEAGGMTQVTYSVTDLAL